MAADMVRSRVEGYEARLKSEWSLRAPCGLPALFWVEGGGVICVARRVLLWGCILRMLYIKPCDSLPT